MRASTRHTHAHAVPRPLHSAALGRQRGLGAVRVAAAPKKPAPSLPHAVQGAGLNEKQLALCDAFIYIPQYGAGTASLNVAVAASIILHHFAHWAGYPERQREVRWAARPPLQHGGRDSTPRCRWHARRATLHAWLPVFLPGVPRSPSAPPLRPSMHFPLSLCTPSRARSLLWMSGRTALRPAATCPSHPRRRRPSGRGARRRRPRATQTPRRCRRCSIDVQPAASASSLLEYLP